MIGRIKGQKVDAWIQGIKYGIIIECFGVGYEVQVLKRELNLINETDVIIIWTHQVQREDGFRLYGFLTKEERDLFRKLIGVSGVGPQIGIALLEQSCPNDLILAITTGDITFLTQAQGIGKRTAERLHIELKKKFSENEVSKSNNSLDPMEKEPESQSESSSLQDLFTSLRGLGYEDFEIRRALQAIANNNTIKIPSNNPSKEESEALIKASLIWLSQEVS